MAKYSTGGVGGDSGGSCELCGTETSDLQTATVAGATIQVCGECAQHGTRKSTGTGGSRDTDEPSRTKRAAQNVARLSDAQKGDATHWEQGADYDDDPLPYLVSDYGERVENARQDAGLQVEELAGELAVDEADLVAVEQGRANRANVGGSLIAALEERLNVELEAE